LIQHRIEEKREEAQRIFATFKKPSNQLDLVFLTFYSPSQRDIFLAKYRTGLFGKLYYKICTCCSKTAIRGQHISVVKAPQPEDIDWLNLEFNYWTKKLHRLACYYTCFALLLYGLMFQYEISIWDSSDFVIIIVRTAVVFIGNFLIITLLEYTTYEI
jgi:hypothetical protein